MKAENNERQALSPLQELQQRFDAYLDGTNAFLWESDATGTYTFCSANVLPLLGYEVADMIGKTPLDFMPAEDAARLGSVFADRTAQKHDLPVFSHKLIRKDGAIAIFECSGKPIYEGQGRLCGYRGLYRDVTDPKWAEGLAAGQNRVLELVAQGAPLSRTLMALTQFIEEQAQEMVCSILLLDPDGIHLRRGAGPSLPESFLEAVDGLEIGPRSGACGTAAYTGRQVISSDIASDPLWVDYRDWIISNYGFRACWSTPILSADEKVLGTFAMYYRQPRSPGPREFELIERSTHLGRIAIERERTKAALQESEDRFRSMAEKAHDIIFRVQMKPAPKYVFVSPSAERILGYSPAQFYRDPKLAFKIVHPDDRALLAESEPGRYRSSQRQTIRWIRKDGEVVFLEENVVPTFDGSGELVAIEGIARDVTDRVRAEQKLKDSEEQLRALSAKLISVQEQERTRIALQMHDELGQTLTALMIDLNWLSKRLPGEEKGLAKKVDDMISLASTSIQTVRRISAELRPRMLDELGLEAALKWQVSEFQNRTGIQSRLTIDPEEIGMDPLRRTTIFRFVQETLTNVARHAGATEVDIALRENGQTLSLVIRDNGRGISEADRKDPNSLGLFSLRERVRQCGGQLEIRGIAGKGSTFTVHIPLDAGQSVSAGDSHD